MTTGTPPTRTEVGNYFVSNYPPFSQWKPEYVPEAIRALEQPPRKDEPLGLYIHIPFCRKRCKFCYFKVYTDKNASEIELYLDALIKENELYSLTRAFQGRQLRFAYFGGGTPSYISEKQLHYLVAGLNRHVSWENAEEVTFECEPGTLQKSKLKALKEIGVTRLSLGIEHFDDKILEANGRAHLSPEIYKDGIQSPIADWITKRYWLDYAFEQFQEHGYQIASTYTLATGKKPCRFIYTDALWHGGDMIGLGVSSFSHFGGVNFQNAHNFEEYLRILNSDRLPLLRAVSLTAKQRLTREMVLQLKTGQLDTEYFRQKFGANIWEEFQPVYEQLKQQGLLDREEKTITLTRRGLLEVDHFLLEFFEPELRTVRYA